MSHDLPQQIIPNKNECTNYVLLLNVCPGFSGAIQRAHSPGMGLCILKIALPVQLLEIHFFVVVLPVGGWYGVVVSGHVWSGLVLHVGHGWQWNGFTGSVFTCSNNRTIINFY